MKLMKRLLFHDCFVNQLSIEAEVGHFGACHSFLRGGERRAERHHGIMLLKGTMPKGTMLKGTMPKDIMLKRSMLKSSRL